MRSRKFVLGLSAGAAAITSPAFGQAPPEIADIIVTARKVEESQQSTPVAITAYSQDDLDKRNISRPIDLQYNTPALQVSRTPSGQGSYTIRGQGQGFGTPPGVLVYFAGAPIAQADTGANGAQFGLYDLGSVQVLKGPQGTLFGRTSTGGAILFEPQRPTDKLEGYASVQAGSRDLRELSGAINLPIIEDVLSIRLAGQLTKQDGYTRSITTNQLLDNNNYRGLRLGIKFKPADWFENYMLLQYNDTRNNASSILYNGNRALYNPANFTGTLTAVCGGAAALSGVPGNAAFVAGCVAQRQQLLADVQTSMTASMARVAAGDIRRNGTSSIFNNINQSFAIINDTTLRAPDFGPVTNFQVRNILNLPTLGRKQIAGYEVDGLDVRIGDFVQSAIIGNGTCTTSGTAIGQCTLGTTTPIVTPKPNSQFSDEVNVNATLFDRFDLLLGYYYARSENRKAMPSSAFSSFQNTFSPRLAANPNVGYQTYAKSWERGKFIQGTLDLKGLIDGLRLTGGYRWNTNYNIAISSTTPTSVPVTNALKFKGYNYTMSADWQVTQGMLLYVRRSRAFKPGGLNPVTCTNNAPPCPLTFGAEVVKDIEAGIKWDWGTGDLRGRTNIAAYMVDDGSIQRRFAGTVSGLNYLRNVAEAKTKGFEIDQTLLYSGVELSARFSYQDAYYTRWWSQAAGFPCTDPIGNSANNCADYSSSAFSGTPKYQFNLNLAYNFALGDLGEVRPALNFYRQAKVNYADVPFTDPGAVEPAYSLWSARIDWNNVSGMPLRASLFVRNLGNKAYATGRGSVFPTLGTQTISFAEPRTIGVELNYRFGQ